MPTSFISKKVYDSALKTNRENMNFHGILII